MKSRILLLSLPTLLALGCQPGAESETPKFDVPAPKPARVTPSGKKVNKPPLAPRSPSREPS
jgi:hypothetical protein